MPAETAYYVYNVEREDGPGVQITSLSTDQPIKKFLQMLLLSTPKMRIDFKQEFKPLPNIFVAQQEADKRKAALRAADPDRMLATDIYPDIPNRILEDQKDN